VYTVVYEYLANELHYTVVKCIFALKFIVLHCLGSILRLAYFWLCVVLPSLHLELEWQTIYEQMQENQALKRLHLDLNVLISHFWLYPSRLQVKYLNKSYIRGSAFLIVILMVISAVIPNMIKYPSSNKIFTSGTLNLMLQYPLSFLNKPWTCRRTLLATIQCCATTGHISTCSLCYIYYR